jgi:hypothetical protein
MRKADYVSPITTLVLLSLGMILIQPPRLGPGVLDAESSFYPALHNSLYYLDIAKGKWAEEKHESEKSTPTMQDLAPYLGDWKATIERFTELGINYRITSMAEPQSDVATLTHDLRFRRGFCRFYPAGTSYCIHTGWAWIYPQLSTTSRLRAIYINDQYLIAGTLCVLAMGNLLVFVIMKMRNSKRTSG